MEPLTNTLVPDVKQKSLFEESLSKLDLQGTLTLLTVLSERALFLHSVQKLQDSKIVKPKTLIT
jgi:hypothetical protein